MAFAHLASLRLADRIHQRRIAKYGTKRCPKCERTIIADADDCGLHKNGTPERQVSWFETDCGEFFIDCIWWLSASLACLHGL